MNWKRVFLHISFFLVGTFVAGVQFGYVEKSFQLKGLEVPRYIRFLDAISGPIIAISVFSRLATIQQEDLYKHAWAVAIGAWLLSIMFNLLISSFDMVTSLLQIIAIAICLVIGVAIGAAIHKRKSKVKVAV